MTKGDGKPCKKCGTSDWYKDGGCKVCHREYSNRWKKENPDKVNQLNEKWKEENPDKVKKSKQAWYRRNWDKVKEQTDRWHRDNPEKHIESVKRWQAANPAKVKSDRQRWKRDNKDKVNASTHRRRTRKTEAGGSYTAAEWKALKKQYDNRCLACGKKTKLTADHVIPIIAGGSSDISNIQPLCGLCNSIKGSSKIDYRTKPGIKRWIQRRLLG